jgi:hypothetical protein
MGPAPHLGDKLAVQVAFAVSEALGQTADTVTVDDAVGDEAHGATDDIGPQVPLGRAWRGVRAAALAGPETGELGGGRGRVEADVGPLGGDGRATRPADPGRRHAREEPPVEAGVLGPNRPVATLEVLQRW